jgi:hypothetical protein
VTETCEVWPYRENHVWPVARAAALLRDGGLCVRCGGTGSRIEVNHITPRWGDRDQVSCIHHLDGLETLCRECHTVATREQYRSRTMARRQDPRPHVPRKCWAAVDIAEYLSVTKTTVHRMRDVLPEPMTTLNEGGSREQPVWACVEIIAWAKQNGWIPWDDPREGVDLDDPDYNPWMGTRHEGPHARRMREARSA